MEQSILQRGTVVILKYHIDKEEADDYEIKSGEEGTIMYHVNHKDLNETPCYMVKFSGKRLIQLTQYGFNLK